MKAHVREAIFQDKPTSLARFLGNAMLAIATYESRSLRKPIYDRERAYGLLTELHGAVWALLRPLKQAVAWPQLNRYVENLYAADCKRHERQLILKQ